MGVIDLRGSLRKRIVFAFTALSLVLSVAWGLGAFAAIRLTEDRVLERQLALVAADWQARAEAGGDTGRLDSAFVTGYRDPRELPRELLAWALSSPPVGFHEFAEEELQVAVLDVDNFRDTRFLVFDVAGIEAPSSEDAVWFAGLAALALLMGLGAMAFGLVIGRSSVEPMVRLAGVVAEVDPERLGESDRARLAAHRFGRNEAGLLANAIERMVTRICEFIERERSFTAAASHELRTPVTVIRGALELLEQAESPQHVHRVVERIRRANADMQSTIEMFLSLARESHGRQAVERIRVLAVVEKAVEDCGPLLRAKDGLADVQADADPAFEGHALAFATVVGNLLRNAIEHGPQDERPMIVIRLGRCELVVRNRSESVSVSDQAPSANPAPGFGLEIVDRLCEHNGWSFGLTDSDGETTARISWAQRRSAQRQRSGSRR